MALDQVRCTLAMGIVRYVDVYSRGYVSGGRTMRVLCAENELPEEILDTRHELAHGGLVSIDTLILVARACLEHCYIWFWRPIVAKVNPDAILNQSLETTVPQTTELSFDGLFYKAIHLCLQLTNLTPEEKAERIQLQSQVCHMAPFLDPKTLSGLMCCVFPLLTPEVTLRRQVMAAVLHNTDYDSRNKRTPVADQTGDQTTEYKTENGQDGSTSGLADGPTSGQRGAGMSILGNVFRQALLDEEVFEEVCIVATDTSAGEECPEGAVSAFFVTLLGHMPVTDAERVHTLVEELCLNVLEARPCAGQCVLAQCCQRRKSPEILEANSLGWLWTLHFHPAVLPSLRQQARDGLTRARPALAVRIAGEYAQMGTQKRL
ncbi:Las1-like protein [Gregarina niphandrodes]|uniref:Las1-like protein n=1 Tax=Gregarina niphandrodes TaxID=110365 RepID=A0A023BD95_GRENI|nr:Las1-like protein [Gregarina niphandrodes]EZG87592.1 Las1-like protein [Gregarina niphandrodes]|eukprot:XP_011128645.1 Las1-like protein [Gregarina niphandrodes]